MRILIEKKLLFILGISLILFSSFFLVAKAQEASTTQIGITATGTNQNTSPERRENLDNPQQQIPERTELSEQRQASTTERIERRVERQIALETVRQQRVLNLSANISNRMEAVIERLFQIIERFEQRIEKIKLGGIDTTQAETKLREATQLLASARATLANIDNLVYNATTSTEPKSSWQLVRETYLETGRLIRASHQALRETISLLKTAISDDILKQSLPVSNESSSSSEIIQ